MSDDAQRAPLPLLTAVACAALAVFECAAADLGHTAAVQAERSQTQLRFQQAMRAARAPRESPGTRANREHLERARLGDLQVRQQRQAGAIGQSLDSARRVQAEAHRYRTLERFEREQRREVDRARIAASRPAAAPAPPDSAEIPARRSRPEPFEP